MDFILWLKTSFAFAFSCLLTFYFVPIFSNIAYTVGILDRPDGKIKTHSKATPYLGGLAIYCGFITTLTFVLPFENRLALLLLGSTLLLFLGLVDDLIRIKPYQKFAGQCIASLCFLKAGLHFKETFFLKNIWNIPISLLWILTIINAFNLVDVMDGLATLLAIGATATFFVIAAFLGHVDLLILLAAFLGALIAFFYYNKPPASIYMGDAGALFIGGFLAVVPFLYDWGTYSWYGFITPCLILGIPLLEVGTLILVRTYKGIPFYQGSPHHFSIYLRNKGWNVQVVLLYISILLFLILGFSLSLVLGIVTGLSLVLAVSLFLVVWFSILFYTGKTDRKAM